MWRNSEHRYGLVSILLHWTIALGIIGLVGLGAWMVELTYYDRWYYDALALHKAFGVLVLILVLVKFGWRFADPKPAFGPEVGPWACAGATAMHWLLNALLVVVPVTGYVISTSEGAGIDLFGLFELPAFLEVSERIRDLSIDVNYYLAYGGLALVALHAGAALKHHFVDKGSTLARMVVPRTRGP